MSFAPSLRPVILAAAATLGLLASDASAVLQVRNVQLLAQANDYPLGGNGYGYSSCWGYVHGDGREYAIIGTNAGTAIYRITNPAAPVSVGFITGPNSPWREMKSYRNWIYIVTEGSGAGQGVQIVRMTNPDSPVLVGSYVTNFIRSHTVSIDTTRALLICNGTNSLTGNAGIRILSLANPEAPVEVGKWPPLPNGTAVPDTMYSHDSVPIGNLLYSSSIYAGIERVFDIANPASPVLLKQWTYSGAFTHNAWPDATGNYLYVTDELVRQPLKVFDISNLAAPTLVNTETSNENGIVHNAHVNGNELFLANYTEGIRVLDVTDPAHPAEFAYADSYSGTSGDYSGVWGIYPYFPSGVVIASDRNSGLYVYQVDRNYGTVRVELQSDEVKGVACGLGIGGGCCCAPAACTCEGHAHVVGGVASARVYLDTTDSLLTAMDGVGVFAPNPGSYMVKVRAFGYDPVDVPVTVTAGTSQVVSLTLVAKPSVAFSGSIRDAGTLLPLEEAELILSYTPLHDHTDAAGAFDFGFIPSDQYRVEARASGHIPLVLERSIGPVTASGVEYQLRPATRWESGESGVGWSLNAVGDNATGGLWTRGEPFGTGTTPPANATTNSEAAIAPRPSNSLAGESDGGGGGFYHEGHGAEGDLLPGSIQPELDKSPPPGTLCWFTGQGNSASAADQADVDGGRTTLTSPTFDLTGMADPTIGFWRWLYTNQPYDSNDYLAVSLSNDNGGSFVPVRTLTGLQNHWVEETVRVLDFLPATSLMKVRFVAADLGTASTVEAAIDDVTAYDASLAPVGVTPAGSSREFQLAAPWPNPSAGQTVFALYAPHRSSVVLEVLDVTGRHVASLPAGSFEGWQRFTWDGRDATGGRVGAGLYFVRARWPERTLTTRFARVG
ncbi:MAG: choice-of-anchor B family protein [Candidatus Eisenbacteria bacterium]|uniref:Choice-of-anchor B family protein n=1 Tax=Eiseniibacteriota bacterium TaxID=2212470 RepID=A0A849SHM3_UNCEI|nr:choice-of-anchor B family protein [Candidatus Eisenbacteria bacterium]